MKRGLGEKVSLHLMDTDYHFGMHMTFMSNCEDDMKKLLWIQLRENMQYMQADAQQWEKIFNKFEKQKIRKMILLKQLPKELRNTYCMQYPIHNMSNYERLFKIAELVGEKTGHIGPSVVPTVLNFHPILPDKAFDFSSPETMVGFHERILQDLREAHTVTEAPPR